MTVVMITSVSAPAVGYSIAANHSTTLDPGVETTGDDVSSHATDGTITSCKTNITASGTYELGSDLASNGLYCIHVNASGVTIDGDGHVIDFDEENPQFSRQAAITLDHPEGTLDSITIKNVTLRDWGTAVYIEQATGVTLKDVRVEGDAAYRGVRMWGNLSGITITESTLNGSSIRTTSEETYVPTERNGNHESDEFAPTTYSGIDSGSSSCLSMSSCSRVFHSSSNSSLGAHPANPG